MTSVFILIDALGWELVKNRPFLQDLLPYRRELQTIFGFSSAAIPSILTGLLPREHGHWNLFVYDPANSPFRWAKLLRLLPNRAANHRVVRKAVSIIGRKVARSRGYFQLYGVPVQILPYFDICEKENIYATGGMHPSRSIFDLLEAKGTPYKVYSYHAFTDRQAVEQAAGDIRGKSAAFYFVYLSALDEFLHKNIHDPSKVDEELERYAAEVRALYNAATSADPCARFYVFSDHGMTPIRGTIDVMGAVEQTGWKVPSDYLALYDATMARFWFFSNEARDGIEARLRGISGGKIISEADCKALGIDFGHNRFGDLIFLMNEGYLMYPSHMGRLRWPGMHGFHPTSPSSSAVLLARSQPPVEVSNIRDIFRLMQVEAGLDGSSDG